MRDEAGRIFIAETSPKPPPLIRVIGFGDTASMGSYIGKAKGTPRDIILLDESPASAAAMLSSIDAGSGGTSLLARWRQRFSRNFGERFKHGDSLVIEDLDGEPGALTREATKDGPEVRLAQLEDFHRSTGKLTRIGRVPDGEMNQLLGSLGWDSARDGVPQATRISFDAAQSNGYEAIDVVAGFKSGAADQLPGVVTTRLADQIGNDLMLGAVQLSIRKALYQLDRTEIGRITFVVHRHGTAATQFTLLFWPIERLRA
jgi:hypothetical protein